MRSRNEIIKYLKGEMSDADRFEFEKEMLSDPFLNDAVEGFQELPIGELDQVLRDTDIQLSKHHKSAIPKLRVWMTAATVIIALGAGLIFMLRDPIENKTVAVNIQEKSYSDKKEEAEKAGVNSVKKEASKNQIENETEPEPEPESESLIDDTKTETTQDLDIEVAENKNEIIDLIDTSEPDQTIELASTIEKEGIKVALAVQETNAADILDEGDVVGADSAPEVREREVQSAPSVARSKKALSSEIVVFSGIISSTDGPIGGVNIYREGGPLKVTSEDGVFTWEFGYEGVRISKNGYQDTSLIDSEIVLSRSNPKMEYEVQVSGNKLSQITHPIGGRDVYLEYLNEQLKYPEDAQSKEIEGIVSISFQITESGTIRNIQVIQGLTKSCDEEAIRLIADGTNWVPGFVNSKLVSSTILLNVVFKLD